MKYERITTHDIRVGDLIQSDSMKLRVDREPKQTQHPVREYGGITLATPAVIENWDELVREANEDRARDFGNSVACFIVSRVQYDRFHAEAMGREPDTEPRWTIQGNGLAHWGRVIEEEI